MTVRQTCEYQAVIDTPVARLGIILQGQALQEIDFLDQTVALKEAKTKAVQQVVKRLERYFHDSKVLFDLPLAPVGTPFQQKVWQAMQRIPSGEVRTYGQLAAELKTSARAVGNACRANPRPIVVPCHRVVAVNGLGGFSGDTSGDRLAIKRRLLEHEGAL